MAKVLTFLAVDGEPSRACAHCERGLTLESFSADKQQDDGLRVYCKDCAVSKNKTGLAKAARTAQAANATIEDIKEWRFQQYLAAQERKEAAQKAEKTGRMEARAFEKELDRLQDKKKEQGDDAPRLRKTWPTDPKKRLKSMLKDLPRAIAVCDGQEATLASLLNLGITEVMDVVQAHPDLWQQFQQAQNEAVSKVEAKLLEAAVNGSGPDVRFWLQNNSEKYRSKTQVDVKNVGFGPPPAADAPVSVLKVVNGKDSSCDDD